MTFFLYYTFEFPSILVGNLDRNLGLWSDSRCYNWALTQIVHGRHWSSQDMAGHCLDQEYPGFFSLKCKRQYWWSIPNPARSVGFWIFLDFRVYWVIRKVMTHFCIEKYGHNFSSSLIPKEIHGGQDPGLNTKFICVSCIPYIYSLKAHWYLL